MPCSLQPKPRRSTIVFARIWIDTQARVWPDFSLPFEHPLGCEGSCWLRLGLGLVGHWPWESRTNRTSSRSKPKTSRSNCSLPFLRSRSLATCSNPFPCTPVLYCSTLAVGPSETAFYDKFPFGTKDTWVCLSASRSVIAVGGFSSNCRKVVQDVKIKYTAPDGYSNARVDKKQGGAPFTVFGKNNGGSSWTGRQLPSRSTLSNWWSAAQAVVTSGTPRIASASQSRVSVAKSNMDHANSSSKSRIFPTGPLRR